MRNIFKKTWVMAIFLCLCAYPSLRADTGVGPDNGTLVIVGGAMQDPAIFGRFLDLAGATIQGSFLVRGDTQGNEIMIGDHLEGFGFLRNTGIDQHLLKRNRQFDLFEVLDAYPDLLGIGIDEDTAIVVQGDQFEVIGQGYVAVYDTGRLIPPNGRFYFLAPGDRFNLKERQAFRSIRRWEPLDRVKRKKE
jgi:hypothetical protein